MGIIKVGYRFIYEEEIAIAPPDDCVANWKFDGDFTDETGNYDASLIAGTVPFVNNQRGELSSAASFTQGSTDSLQIGQMNETFSEITISFWYYIDGGRDYRSVFLLSNSGRLNDEFLLIESQDGNLYPNSLGVYFGSSRGKITQNNLSGWNHIVLEITFNTIKSWVNNVLYLDESHAQEFEIVNPAVNNFGAVSGAQANGCYLSDFRLYKRTLSSEERTAIYSSELDGTITYSNIIRPLEESTYQEIGACREKPSIVGSENGNRFVNWGDNISEGERLEFNLEDLQVNKSNYAYLRLLSNHANGVDILYADEENLENSVGAYGIKLKALPEANGNDLNSVKISGIKDSKNLDNNFDIYDID